MKIGLRFAKVANYLFTMKFSKYLVEHVSYHFAFFSFGVINQYPVVEQVSDDIPNKYFFEALPKERIVMSQKIFIKSVNIKLFKELFSLLR